MDIWTVVAAAGAGYVAQHWKKITAGRQDVQSENAVLTSSESSSVKQQVQEKHLPVRRALSSIKEEKDVCLDIDLSSHDTDVEEAFISTYCRENLTLGHLGYNIPHSGEGCNDDISRCNGEYTLEPSNDVSFCSSPSANTSGLRTRRLKGKVLKPLTSLESCLMAQLSMEHAPTDSYVLNSVRSPRAPSNSPFVASERGRMSSRAGGGFLKLPVNNVEKQPVKNFNNSQEKPIGGLSHLPKLVGMNLRKRAPRQTERSRDSSIVGHAMHQNSEGQPNGVLLFCLGISAGILSSFFANQQEVDNLNQLLRQTKNLVEDLQDELEMKDSLTVKELVVEDDRSDDRHHDSLDCGHSRSPKAELDESLFPGHGKCHDEETEVKSLSKIEAELEAELERLELTMNACSLEGKLSNLVELEPDFLPDVAVGEFKAEIFSRQTAGQAYADQDGSGNSTAHPANYAVSPRELSLRLHEVIESRLEARIKELEAALQNRQRKFQYAEYDHIEFWRKIPGSEAESISHSASPVHENEPSRASDPVVINLLDEALETNEANDFFSKVNDTKDYKPHGIISSSSGTSSAPCEQSPFQVQKGWMDNEEDPCRDEEADNTMFYDTSSSRESDGGSQNEIEQLLIQHIVQRARKQGSSVILNAQKALFSGNENGQRP